MVLKMIISLSGTPGTGKTVVARELAKNADANLISIGELVNKKKIPYKIDKKRKTKSIDIRDLQKSVKKRIVKNTINIIEGHLSHLLKTDRVIILRMNPMELKKRLIKRKWSRAKVEENVQAEILDEITIEALQKHGRRKVFEIDVTSLKKGKITDMLTNMCKTKILNKYLKKRYVVGKVDWSEKYKNELKVRI